MDNNDVLRRLRYALNISNSSMREIFKLAGHDISESSILEILTKEGDADYVPCEDMVLELFLDGFIISRRGAREGEAAEEMKPAVRLSNNIILKKLKIALNYKDSDMFDTFNLAGFEISKPELSALFRKKGHKNYKVCGDQIVKMFIRGLTLRFRKEAGEDSEG